MTGAFDFLLAGPCPDGSRPALDAYLAHGGYDAARRALTAMAPEEIVEEVRQANLRGRGGAGFPAGLKWSFVPREAAGPKYLCVNADEGEPGTSKDRVIIHRCAHTVLEGMLIAARAIGAHLGFIYVRGEYETAARRLEAAVAEARRRGFLGPDALGTGFAFDVEIFRGAGAYICGEETAMLESVEGRRGQPRLKPPFPAVKGLFQAPTLVNNVETIACLPLIIRLGAAWFRDRGLARDGGTRLFSVSGAVVRPGVYEMPVGTRLVDLIEGPAGGVPHGRTIKAVIPGGMSAPLLTPGEIDVSLDFDSLARAGSMLGSAAVVVIDETTPILDVLRIVARFYAHESCGKCTPCRIGTAWIHKIVERLAAGGGRREDLETISRAARSMAGRTLCPMGEAAAFPVQAIVAKFRGELEAALHG